MRGGGNLLGGVVQSQGEVLPVLKVDGRVPEEVGIAAQQLPRLLVGAVGADAVAGVEVELVGAVVGSLVPDVLEKQSDQRICVSNREDHRQAYQVLVAQVERLLQVLLDAPVQGDDAAVGRVVGAVGRELQARAAEAVLLLEDGVVVDGHFDRLVLGHVELRRRDLGHLEDLRPGDVVALDVVGVEDAILGVEGSQGGVGGHAAVEQDGALRGVDLAVAEGKAEALAVGRAGWRGQGGARKRGEEDKDRRHFCAGM